MALVVEDGSGLANAESYADIAALTSYAAGTGKTLTGTEAAQEAALRNATTFIDTAFRFDGRSIKRDQALRWPRTGVHDDEDFLIDASAVPGAVVKACCALAIEALSAPLDADPDEAGIKRTRKKVDVIEKEVEYSGRKGTVRRFPEVERLLATVSGSRMVASTRLVRS